MVTTDNHLLAPHELARVLNVSLSWVRTHSAPASKNRLPVRKVGGFLRFDLQEVQAWLRENRRGSRELQGQTVLTGGRHDG